MHDVGLGRDDFEALAAEILAGGNTLRFRAQGTSMVPTIKNGDIVEVWPAGGAEIQHGEVILCRSSDGRLVVHRTVGVARAGTGTCLVTRGDALARPDGTVRAEDILGRVGAIERRGRRVRLDAGSRRLAGRLWSGCWPWSGWIYSRLAAFMRTLLATVSCK